MRVFVTGATGFIGSHLVRRLVAEGHEVIAMVRTPAKAAWMAPLGVRIFEADLSLFEQPCDLPEVDVFIHLAAVVTGARDPEDYFRLNARAVEQLLARLSDQAWTPKRLLFSSSLAAAGPSQPGEALDEDAPLQPIDDYGRGKRDAEQILEAAPFPVTVFRPPVVLGPGDPATLGLYQAARRGTGMRLARRAPQQLSFVYISDLVDAILRMATDERDGSFTYFTPYDQPADTTQLWDALGQSVGRKVVLFPIPEPVLWAAARVAMWGSRTLGIHTPLDEKMVRQMVEPAFVCRNDRLKQELGWSPSVGLVEAASKSVEGYRELGQL